MTFTKLKRRCYFFLIIQSIAIVKKPLDRPCYTDPFDQTSNFNKQLKIL